MRFITRWNFIVVVSLILSNLWKLNHSCLFIAMDNTFVLLSCPIKKKSTVNMIAQCSNYAKSLSIKFNFTNNQMYFRNHEHIQYYIIGSLCNIFTNIFVRWTGGGGRWAGGHWESVAREAILWQQGTMTWTPAKPLIPAPSAPQPLPLLLVSTITITITSTTHGIRDRWACFCLRNHSRQKANEPKSVW